MNRAKGKDPLASRNKSATPTTPNARDWEASCAGEARISISSHPGQRDDEEYEEDDEMSCDEFDSSIDGGSDMIQRPVVSPPPSISAQAAGAMLVQARRVPMMMGPGGNLMGITQTMSIIPCGEV